MFFEDGGVIVEFILDISSSFYFVLVGVVEVTALMLDVSKL